MEIPIYPVTVPYPIQGRGQFPSTAVKKTLAYKYSRFVV